MAGANPRLIKGQEEGGAVQAMDPDVPKQKRKIPKWSKWLLASAAISSAAVVTLCSTKIIDLTPEPKPMPPKEETCDPAVRNSPTAFVFAAKIKHDVTANSEEIKKVLGSSGSDVIAHTKVTLSPKGAVDYKVLAYAKDGDSKSSADITSYVSINKDLLVFPAPGNSCNYHIVIPVKSQ